MIADTRGRVPFAVVAVLLLVSSATVATTVTPAPPPDEPAVDDVLDRIDAERSTALRRAVRQASRDAAHAPVLDPANTSVGRALSRKEAFRDSLRLRIYVAARDRFEALERRRGDVVGRVDLPAIDADDTASVRAAIERIDLAAADDNASAITVRVENVTTTIRRGGRRVTERVTSPQVTVATPVLSLHERVETYERRLNADLTKPGLERRLAVLLNAVGWARGYAQYRGAPIGNVISNTHVELATNAAILDVQRATIGRVDPDGIAGLGTAVAHAGIQRLLSMGTTRSPFLQQALDRRSPVAASEIAGLGVPGRDETMTIGVDRTAADTFLSMVSSRDSPAGPRLDDVSVVELSRVLANAYSADVRLAATVTSRSGGKPGTPPSPGDDWARVDATLAKSVDVRPGGRPDPPTRTGDWHPLDAYSRTVVTEYERTATWANGSRRRETTATDRTVETVSVTVLGTHAPDLSGPPGRIRDVHELGAGPLDGPNLADIRAAATDRLLGERGGRDAVARRAAAGTVNESIVTVYARRPAKLREWVYRDLAALRETVANVSVDVDRTRVGSFAANPPALLATELADRRAALLDAAPPYEGIAERARVAARSKYLSLVVRALDERAAHRRHNRDRLGNALDDVGAESVAALQRSVEATVENPGERQGAVTGLGGPFSYRVDAAPAYLTTDAIDEQRVPAVDGSATPLAVRNVNLFSLPYGVVVGGFLDGLLSEPDRTSLGTAARTVRTGREHAGIVADASDAVDDLAASVRTRIRTVKRTAAGTLARRGVCHDEKTCRGIVEVALQRWNGSATTALAVANGSAAAAIVDVAADRTTLSVVERDRLRLELDRAIRATLERDAGRPRSSVVSAVRDRVKGRAAEALRTAAGKLERRAVERLTNASLSRLPSGLALAPVPGYWYATTNVWHVEVAGEYARFGLRATRGRPVMPGAGLVYVRDGDGVSLDVDGDGTAERLGRARRVRFSATVDVVVVVPPGLQGVGDVAAARDERSPGWRSDGE